MRRRRPPTRAPRAAPPQSARTDGPRTDDRRAPSRVGSLVDSGVDALGRAAARGVPVAYGSDLLGRSHRRQLEGIALHCRAQPAADVLAALTVVPARLVGAEGLLGRVAEGGAADLLVLNDERVLDDPSLLAREGAIAHVVQGGIVVR